MYYYIKVMKYAISNMLFNLTSVTDFRNNICKRSGNPSILLKAGAKKTYWTLKNFKGVKNSTTKQDNTTFNRMVSTQKSLVSGFSQLTRNLFITNFRWSQNKC